VSSDSNIVTVTSISNSAPTVDTNPASLTIGYLVDTTIDVCDEATCNDADGDTITVDSIVTQGAVGTAAIVSGTDKITYQTDVDLVDTTSEDQTIQSTDSVVVKMTDSKGGTVNVTLSITIEPIPSGTLYVEETIQKGSTIITSQCGINIKCFGDDGTDIDHNRKSAGAYVEAGLCSDSSGVIKFPLYDAVALGYSAGQQVYCAMEYDDATANQGIRTWHGPLTLQAEP
jgi:hypothetical protein